MFDHRNHWIIAHRGASAFAPENTMAAFYKAHDMGARWIETDVKLTRCKTMILFHDDDLLRTAGIQTKIQELEWEKLQTQDVGGWFSEKFRGEVIPCLDDLLDWALPLGMNLNLELKPCIGTEMYLAEAMAQRLMQLPKQYLEQILVSSFDFSCLKHFQSRMTRFCRTGLLMDQPMKSYDDWIDKIKPWSIHINHRWVNLMPIHTWKNGGLKVMAYTVNDPSRAFDLFQMGVDAVFSDDPGLLQAISDSLGR